ncbi:MAG: ABC transporter ATP-binding protein [Candidatus Kapabacteria bacterium]|nr:ABC transporter ATP-binding protein [Candidatus Kapabacteria bacterium]
MSSPTAADFTVRRLARIMLPFVRPAWQLVVFSTVANLLFSSANALILAVVEPVFRTLFGAGASPLPTGAMPASGFMKAFNDTLGSFINSGDRSESLRSISLVIIGLFVVRGLTKYASAVISTRLEEGIMKRVRDALFNHVTEHSLDFFSKRKAGEIISLLTNDVHILNHATINSITVMWREASTVIIYLTLLAMISLKLTLISIAVSMIGLLLIRTATRLLRSYGARLQAAQADYTSTLQETVFGIRVVKGMNLERFVTTRFAEQTAAFVRRATRNARVMGLIPMVNDTFGIVALVTVFYIGSMDSAAGIIAPSSLMTFLFLLFGLMQPISAIVNTIAAMQRGIAAGANVAAALGTSPSINTGAASPPEQMPVLEASNVSFSYGERHVLRNVSFTIHPGEKVALVGASGSGKSTMLDMIMRFYDPASGAVRINGSDVRTFDLGAYRRLFGVVSQETLLFNDTIVRNIALGDESPNAQRVEAAARIAHADGFIRETPDGYETVIGDRGMRLSGGQRQRIAIARALYRQPQILLFDEATSALDTESERLVQGAIDDALVGRTAIIVAHRLSTIVNADRILVFDDGQIVEHGTHAELLAQRGVYHRLYEMQ